MKVIKILLVWAMVAGGLGACNEDKKPQENMPQASKPQAVNCEEVKRTYQQYCAKMDSSKVFGDGKRDVVLGKPYNKGGL